ncbi:MAG TPA: c-type cytochrome [Ideonella sp.]|nr:c-type cytochrome [Ideonella sp.]
MKQTLRSCLLALAACAPLLANASDALATRYACVACHQAERKVVGPSWKEIATKYADGSKTPAQMAATIRAGSKGVWGPMAMPAQAAISEADATTLATWVLQKR